MLAFRTIVTYGVFCSRFTTWLITYQEPGWCVCAYSLE